MKDFNKKLKEMKLRARYRIKPLNTIPPMFAVEEYDKTGHGNKRGWKHVCLAMEIGIAQGVINDIVGQALETDHAVRD